MRLGLDEGLPAIQLMKLVPGRTPGQKAANLRDIVRDLINRGELAPSKAVIASPERGYADLSYSEVLEEYNALIKRDAVPVEKVPYVSVSSKETTIVIGDLHTPEHRMDLLMRIAKEHEGSRLIIAGDLMDFQRFSKFTKNVRSANRSLEQRMSVVELLKTGTAVVDILRHYFSDVVIKRGNHDIRLASMLSQCFSDGAELADFLFESMFANMPNVSMMSSAIEDFFMLKRGDAWVGHWDCISAKVTNRGANEAVDWMLDNDYITAQGEWNVLIQLHTHLASLGIHRGKLAIECGCMSRMQDYTWEKPGKYRYPRNGYFELVQYDGITDWEESRLRLLRTKE